MRCGTASSRRCSDLASATGVDRVRPLKELAMALAEAGGGRRVGTLPSADPITRSRQCALSGSPLAQRLGPPGRQPRSRRTCGDGRCDDPSVATRRHDDARARDDPQSGRRHHGRPPCRHGRNRPPGCYEHDVRGAMERELIAPRLRAGVRTRSSPFTARSCTTRPITVVSKPAISCSRTSGREHQGWASDVTRTWPVSGKFSPTQRALYDIVLQSQLDAIAQWSNRGPGTATSTSRACVTLARGLVDEKILSGDPESLVERGAHALFFPHGVGHLLGPRRPRHGGPRRPGRLRPRPHPQSAVRAWGTSASTAISSRRNGRHHRAGSVHRASDPPKR